MTADATLPASDDLTPEVLARWEELAANATEGPWFYNGYSGVFTTPKPDPRDGLTFDEWADKMGEGHTAERYGACPACDTDRPTGCRYAAEWYRRDNSFVAGVPAAYGDTATGIHVADACFIEESRTAVPALLSGVRSRDARIVELEAIIEEAPHSKFCTSKRSAFTATELGRPCDCWKSRYRSGVRHE